MSVIAFLLEPTAQARSGAGRASSKHVDSDAARRYAELAVTAKTISLTAVTVRW